MPIRHQSRPGLSNRTLGYPVLIFSQVRLVQRASGLLRFREEVRSNRPDLLRGRERDEVGDADIEVAVTFQIAEHQACLRRNLQVGDIERLPCCVGKDDRGIRPNLVDSDGSDSATES